MLAAHARGSDPRTSHLAAKAVSPSLTELQGQVESFALSCGRHGFTDRDLARHFGDSGSTMRSRRAELTRRGVIEDSGRRTKPEGSGRLHIVWKHRDA